MMMDEFKSRIDAWNAQREFSATYQHNGREWALSFFAIDEADAEEKLGSIKKTLGWGRHGMAEIVERIPFD